MALFKQDRDFSKHEPAGVPAASIEMQLVLRAMARAEGPQGHGVAQHIHRSDAVLPAVAYGATQQIGRSRLDTGKSTLPILVCFPAEPQDARCQKRHRDNVLKGRAVAVPADPGARRILRHHELFECVRTRFADLARDDGQWAQVVGNTRIRARLLARKDVFVTKGIDPAIAQVSVKFERLERQLFNPRYQVLLLRRRENVCGVAKAGGHRRFSEQIAPRSPPPTRWTGFGFLRVLRPISLAHPCRTLFQPSGALETQKILLRSDATCKACERTIGANQPMARCNDRNRISAAGSADSARCLRLPDLTGDIRVAPRLPKRDREECLPDAFLKIRAAEVEEQCEDLQIA